MPCHHALAEALRGYRYGAYNELRGRDCYELLWKLDFATEPSYVPTAGPCNDATSPCGSEGGAPIAVTIRSRP